MFYVCVWEGLPISRVWEMARGLQTSLEVFKGAKQCLPVCPDPSTSPEERRDSLIPRVGREHNKSSLPGAQRCSQREALRLGL